MQHQHAGLFQPEYQTASVWDCCSRAFKFDRIIPTGISRQSGIRNLIRKRETGMSLPYSRFMLAIMAILFLGCSAASACNVGDIQCENGYKYICKCWTATGCNYEPDGTCYRDDDRSGAAPHVNLPRSDYVREARLICTTSHVTVARESCPGH